MEIDCKEAQRAEAKKLRSRMSPTRLNTVSEQILRRLKRNKIIKRGATIHVYDSQPQWHEIDTHILRDWLTTDLDATIYEPVSPNSTKFSEAINPANKQIADISSSKIDAIICPALAFDIHGNRLGMGAGYYDRLIAAHPEAIVIGLAPSSAKMPGVLSEEHDERLDYIVTETQLLQPK